MTNEETILKKDLIYWIDKDFIQDRAISLFGKKFSEEEIVQVTKYIESGLAYSVFDIIDIALKETKEDSLI